MTKNLTINEMYDICEKLIKDNFGEAEIWIIPPCEEKTIITIKKEFPNPKCTGYDKDMILFNAE